MENTEYNEQENDPFHELLTSMDFKQVVAESPDKITDGYKVIIFQSENDKLLRTIKRWVYKHENVIILNDASKEAFKVENIFAIIVDKDTSETIPTSLKNLKISSNLDFDFIINILGEKFNLF